MHGFHTIIMLLFLRSAAVAAWIRSPLLPASTRALSTLAKSSSKSHSACRRNEASPNVLHQVEATVNNVLKQYQDQNTTSNDFVLTLHPEAREAFGVAQILRKRLQSFYRPGVNCPRCWFQEAHCICSKCPPISLAHLPIHRIFVVMNHKEICLSVDTAKLILSSFPTQSRLVVAGIGPEYQSSMKEMMDAVENDGHETNCLVLFPTENASTFDEVLVQHNQQKEASNDFTKKPYDLIVIDGTWSQARKIHGRLFDEEHPTRVQLREESLSTITAAQSTGNAGINGQCQLRRHPIDWRTISTMEATRLLLKDIAMSTANGKSAGSPFWEDLLTYQQSVNEAALNQLGPPRAKQKMNRQ